MMDVPQMILLGAAGRNVGKTAFACALIRRYAAERMVVGVKITTVQRCDGQCPRGGTGCGVCSSLTGDYSLTEETATGTGKDTARMKEAGAGRVFWLRVQRDHLEAGVRALLEQMPPETCIVCESNSARLAVAPGAFLVLREAGASAIKATCAAVRHCAEREVTFFGNRWDFQPEDCRFEAGRWQVPIQASAAVLAGGRSRRMGRDKGLLSFAGRTLIEHILAQIRPWVDEIVIGANDRAKYAFTGLPVIPDEIPDQGPLMGILSCLQAVRHERVFITACDIPELPAELIKHLLVCDPQADIVMVRSAVGRAEPLLAVYTRRLVPAIRRALARGSRRIDALIDDPTVRVAFVDMPPGDWYRNVNTPDDYHALHDPI